MLLSTRVFRFCAEDLVACQQSIHPPLAAFCTHRVGPQQFWIRGYVSQLQRTPNGYKPVRGDVRGKQRTGR